MTSPDTTGWVAPRSQDPAPLPFAPRRSLGVPTLAALALLSLAAWAALLAQAWRAGGDASFLAALCQPAAGVAAPGLAGFVSGWAATAGLWALMSVAMMLPTSLPMLASYRDAACVTSRPAASPAWLAAGYLAIWFAVSALAALLQVAFVRLAAGWSPPAGLAPILAGGLVGAAGLYQFSPLKLRCLAFCRHDVRREDLSGSARGTFVLGLRQGLGCLGCCGAVMALMLLAGVANLFWMAGFALLMTVEKLTVGLWAPRLIGAILLAAGFAVAVTPVGIVPLLAALARVIAGGSP
jgi:predicted metal-binding membrane protein